MLEMSDRVRCVHDRRNLCISVHNERLSDLTGEIAADMGVMGEKYLVYKKFAQKKKTFILLH